MVGNLVCAVILALLFLAGGCREPKAIVVETPGHGFHYDTAYEELLNSGKSSPLVEGAWRRYVETLDEPVAITRWQDCVSTWEVFYATNRGLIPTTAGSTQARYGNEVLRTPRFGRAEITLPPQQRGSDPRRSPASTPAAANYAETQTVCFDSVREASPEEFAAGVQQQVLRSRQRDLLVFVHGFNVDFESAVIRTAQIALDMPFNGAVVAYCWPSQGGVFNYRADEPINAASVQPFTEFLSTLIQAVPPDTKINIAVHSMGSRIVLQALGQLPNAEAGRKPIANLVLCAPDVGLRDFQTWAPAAVACSERVTLYASSSDSALILSKGLHAEPRAGDAHPPLVLAGVETIDCTAIDFNLMGHSYYGSNTDVLSDLFAVVKEHTPANQRPHLSRRPLGPGQHYWEYTRHAPRMLWTWHFDDTLQR